MLMSVWEPMRSAKIAVLPVDLISGSPIRAATLALFVLQGRRGKDTGNRSLCLFLFLPCSFS